MNSKSTKELARELGLLRKRSVSAQSPRQCRKKQRVNYQPFSYLIVIDFESTCWENDKTIPQEIIEFPAVLVNTNTGMIESEFHYYLQPSERPTLSDFCHQLTGITQEQVDSGIPLSLCLRKFSAWLRRLREEKGIVCVDDKNTASNDTGTGKVAVFVTWSDWDLGVCLLNESRRKQIIKPSALDRWIDLRATYKKFYSRKPDGLNGALRDLGIQFDGREHSGLDDARNTAKLAWRMISDGCALTVTKILKMSHTGKVERVYIPPSSPKASDKLPHPPTAGDPRNNILDQISSHKASPNHLRNIHSNLSQAKTPFRIHCDDPTAEESSLRKHTVRPRLAPRNLNVCSSTDVSDSDRNRGQHSVNSGSNMNNQELKPASLEDKNSIDNSKEKLSKLPIQSTKGKTSTAGVSSISSFNNRNANPLPSSLSKGKSLCEALDSNCNSNTPTSLVINSSAQHGYTNVQPLKLSKFNEQGRIKTVNNKETNQMPSTSSSHSTTPTSLPHIIFKTPTTYVTNSTFKKPTPHLSRNSSTTPTMHQTSLILDNSHQISFNSSVTPTNLHQSFLTFTVTPASLNSSSSVSMKVTPPLCSCGRRSKRRLVQNQGPNTGRWFFTCPNSYLSSSSKSKTCCKFFQWESPAADGRSGNTSKNSFTPVIQSSSSKLQQRSLGMRNTFKVIHPNISRS